MNPDPWERDYRDPGALQSEHTARRICDDGGKEKEENFGWSNWYRLRVARVVPARRVPGCGGGNRRLFPDGYRQN